MKEIKIRNVVAFLLSTTLLASCLKEGTSNVDVNNVGAPSVTLQFIENGSGSTINAGMQYFSGGALSYPASHKVDTATFNVALTGTAATSDVTVTVGVDASKVLDNFKADGISYQLMPDSLYKMMATTATIKAGSSVAPLQIAFYPSKIDPTKSYNLPIVIKDAQGKTISGNFGVIYFHVIGNPLAGTYGVTGYFYHPTAPRAMDRARTLSAVNSTTLVTELGDLGGSGYFVRLKVANPFNTTSVQNVTISIEPGSIDPIFAWPAALPNDNPGYTAGWINSASCNNTYDPATKTFRLRYGYLGGNGYRVTEEFITKK